MFKAGELLERVRAQKPLVHHITNWVTMYDCANIVRMVGALPVMAQAIEESSEMQAISDALVLNIGTLSEELVDSMESASKKASQLGRPVVLDAVGVGATSFRTRKARELLETAHIGIVKGNSSEIATLAGANVQTKGVEATAVEGSLKETAASVAEEYGAVAVITGPEDIVASSDGKLFAVKNGHELLGKFVGTGCMAGSVIGCFAAVEKDCAKASAAALSCFGIAAELAAKKARTPAAFKQQFFDELFCLSAEKAQKMQKVEELE